MAFLIAMIPYYLLSNAHCIGMCGPLVALLARHPHRYEYFLGRFFAFTGIGVLCGWLGEVLHATFLPKNGAAWFSILFGTIVIGWGLNSIGNRSLPHIFSKGSLLLQNHVTPLLIQGHRLAPFALGITTILLPCGQSFFLFTTSALSGSGWIGGWNAALFTLATTPALLIALLSPKLFNKQKKSHTLSLAVLMMCIGTLSICRGLADMEMLGHVHIALHEGMALVLF